VNCFDVKMIFSLVKLVVFVVVIFVVFGMLVFMILFLVIGGRIEYCVVFSDVIGLVLGDDVWVVGVKVGWVKGILLLGWCNVLVMLDVDFVCLFIESICVVVCYCNFIG